MRSGRILHCVESHTEGMPTRVVVGGVGVLPGSTMAERRQRFMAEQDDLRTFLMYEPRGHGAMSGAILQPPTRPDCDWGVLYIEVAGCLPMCGHGTIGVATVLVETGMVTVTEPERIQGLPIYLVHGTLDWMFPVATGRTANHALTLAGARRKLVDETKPVAADEPAIDELMGRNARERLTTVKRGLQSILELLGRDVAVPRPTAQASSRKAVGRVRAHGAKSARGGKRPAARSSSACLEREVRVGRAR